LNTWIAYKLESIKEGMRVKHKLQVNAVWIYIYTIS